MNKPMPKNVRNQLVFPLVFGLVTTTAMFTSSLTNAASPSMRSDAPKVYIVKKGDTLWDISKRFLRSPWRWKEIWAVNPQVKNPHWIYPKDRLLLCTIHGFNMVGRDEGDGCEGIAKRLDGGLSTVKLGPQIRSEALESAIPSIPLGDIRSLLVDGLVMSKDALAKAPYVLSIKEQHVLAAAGDVIYVRSSTPLPLGDTFGIYRQEAPYIDPESKRYLGTEARLVGRGKVIDANSEVSTITLSDSFTSEVREGDRVMIEPESTLPQIFYPTSDAEVAPGRVIRVMDSVGHAAKDSAIVINRGDSEGAKVGQVMAIYHRGLLIHDALKGDAVRLPSTRSGLAMVYKTFDHVSYALVLESENILKEGDEARAAYGE